MFLIKILVPSSLLIIDELCNEHLVLNALETFNPNVQLCTFVQAE